jgi:hypothetical protein
MRKMLLACLLTILGALSLNGAMGDSPAEVIIGGIAAWFEPVVFSHGPHAEIAGDCESCHHFSDGTPATCVSCHEERPGVPSAEQPALKVAYHERCVGCHKEVGSGPVGCEDCHARRSLPEGPALGGS